MRVYAVVSAIVCALVLPSLATAGGWATVGFEPLPEGTAAGGTHDQQDRPHDAADDEKAAKDPAHRETHRVGHTTAGLRRHDGGLPLHPYASPVVTLRGPDLTGKGQAPLTAVTPARVPT